jgi:N-carbamoyl-L-amino-acid hydrolase
VEDLVIERLAGLQSIGRGEAGTTRLPWTPELRAAEEWFGREAASAGLRVERDPAGSLWAVPGAPAPWWGVGSHLDTVRQGGAWDGALGVAAAFEVARRARRPVAVIAFADEEGARFNTPTFGSRALVGRIDADEVLERRDAGGVRMADAMAAFGADPAGLRDAPYWLGRLRGFLEVHIDQSREVAALGVPAAGVSGLAARRRVRVDVKGRADHAGTTPMDERRDALAIAARLIAAATEPVDGLRATATRIIAEPNALSTIPQHVTFWLDLRAADPDAIDAALARLGTGAVESASPPVGFDPAVRAALGGAPEVTCWAGHDAGILAERIPAGMLLVRNERGVSHAPDEEVDPADALAATETLLQAVEALP